MPIQSPADDIKRRYKKRDAELKRELTRLEDRLANTRLDISHLEAQGRLPTEDPDGGSQRRRRKVGHADATAATTAAATPKKRSKEAEDTGESREILFRCACSVISGLCVCSAPPSRLLLSPSAPARHWRHW